MQSGDDSIWESFPLALQTLEDSGRYINAFRAPFQELPSPSPMQVYTLRACSLLVIPPVPGRMPPQGGFPLDLMELSLSRWPDLVQDTAKGLQALPPRLAHDLGSEPVALLQLLEVAMGVGFCHHCYHPRLRCLCTGASQLVLPTSWSQIVQQAQTYEATSSSGSATDLGTATGGLPGYGVPPPGLTPMDYSIWSIPPLEVPLPPELLASPRYQPPVGRAFTQMLIAIMEKQAQVLRATAPQALPPRLPPPQVPPQAPQTAPPLHQLLPSSGSQPATPYQQAVVPLSKLKEKAIR